MRNIVLIGIEIPNKMRWYKMKMFLVFKEWDNENVAFFFDRMEAVKFALRHDGFGVRSVELNGDMVFLD